jgi:hypothetical protein
MANVPAQPLPGRQFTLAAIGPGWKLESNRRRINTADDYGLCDAIAGTCVEVIHDSVADPDTGELYDRTRYRCLALADRPRDPWIYLAADEIDTHQLYGLDRRATAIAARWLLKQVNASRRSWFNPSEISALHDVMTLIKAATQ